MPIMDGYELITNIRQRETSGNHTPVLALTADATKGERERCLSLGMNDYLAKPVPLEALSQTIEIWLNNDSDPLSNEREVDRPGGSAIDRDVVKNYLGDDQNLIDEFVGNYLYLAPRAGAGIQSDYRQHDWNALLEKAHAFKSSSKTIGALDLAELCGSLISACVSRNEGRIGEAFEFFNRELEDVIRELSHWRESSARKRRESNGQ
jgi:CheY-like chemotaxis protein